MNIKENLKCPKCNHKIRTKILSDISTCSFEEIVTLEFLKRKCPKCEEKFKLSYPFYYEDNKYTISFNMDKKSENKVNRYTTSIDDFKEKFLIFSDNLNDILIELLKDYIKEQTKVDCEIRYEGKTDEYLIFFLFDSNRNVKINLSFYNDLLNKSKFRNLNEAYQVTSDNYLYFIRLKI